MTYSIIFVKEMSLKLKIQRPYEDFPQTSRSTTLSRRLPVVPAWYSVTSKWIYSLVIWTQVLLWGQHETRVPPYSFFPPSLVSPSLLTSNEYFWARRVYLAALLLVQTFSFCSKVREQGRQKLGKMLLEADDSFKGIIWYKNMKQKVEKLNKKQVSVKYF